VSAQTQPSTAIRQAVRSLLTLAGLGVALFVAQRVRVSLGIEWSAEAIQESVRGYGAWAPAIYLLLTAGRQLLALPSVVVLVAAGLLFGVGLGSLLGATGITLNALVLYGTSRAMGRQWVQPWLRKNWPAFEARARRGGPAFVAFMTGHPAGVLTPFHMAAGVTGIALPVFLIAVFPAAFLRAGLYALLGANLLDVGSSGFWLSSAALAVLALAPLAHPGLRRRLLEDPEAPQALRDA
jgi:uncharacterized membrane protein YdjX (TVP38/TMEM64 family)